MVAIKIRWIRGDWPLVRGLRLEFVKHVCVVPRDNGGAKVWCCWVCFDGCAVVLKWLENTIRTDAHSKTDFADLE